ncbi:MAG: DUF47 domain-containing protein [Promethearchaeota archaeon]
MDSIKMQKFSKFFSTRRIDKVDSLARDHLAKVVDIVEAFERMINEWIMDNRGQVHQLGQQIDSEERSADIIRQNIVAELTKGEVSAKEREDLLHTIRRLDSCANFCKSASKSLRLIVDVNIPHQIREKVLEMAKILVRQVLVLRKAFQTYEQRNIRRMQKHLLDVSKWEHLMDEQYHSTLGLLLYLDLPTAALLFLKDFLRDIEMAADFVEDTSDYLKILLVRIGEQES